MKTKHIKSKIIKTELVQWQSLQWFQSSLKDITDDQLQKLKESLINNDFIAPFHVCEIDDQLFILDGHHRKKALESLQSEGVIIPSLLPANFVQVKNKKEAAKLVLLFSSQYAKIINEGLTDFLFHNEVTIDDIPEVSISELNLDDYAADYEDVNFVDQVNESVNFIVKCDSIADLEVLKQKLNVKSSKVSLDKFLEILEKVI